MAPSSMEPLSHDSDEDRNPWLDPGGIRLAELGRADSSMLSADGAGGPDGRPAVSYTERLRLCACPWGL